MEIAKAEAPRGAVAVPSYQLRLLIAALATLLFVFALGFQSPVYAADPVDDCFGGALSTDPLHCHVLEEAHNAGIIEVDAIYGVARGLFIYLTQDDSVGEYALEYIERTAQEEARRTGEHECVFEPDGCRSGVLSIGTGYILPESSVYQDIQLLPGGAEARRSCGGWQAFRELWPGGAAGAVGSGQAPGGDGFNVSDVDVTNFPVLRGNCGELMGRQLTSGSCVMWERNPGIRIAGWQSTDKAYVQIRIPNGDESQIAAAKNAVIQSKSRGLNEDNVEIIAVNHDYEELWRWSLILDRFAHSSGNTLGLASAQLGYNINLYAGEPAVVWPLDDIQEAYEDRSEWRTIIHLHTLDVPGTAAALPQLLRQLSIPLDAVGLIVERVFTPPSRGVIALGSRLAAGVDSSGVRSADAPTEPMAVAGTGQSANSIVVISASLVLGLAVLGAAGFILIRRRRAMSPRV